MEPSVVPVCLYKKQSSEECYITLPYKKLNKKGNTVTECLEIPGMDLILQFYGINPDIRPIPPGTVLLCAKNVPNENVTIDVVQIYNPFDYIDNCVRFTAWFDPVPYTIPLYISKNGNSLSISLENKNIKNYENLYFSPIYVLVDPRLQLNRTRGHKATINDFKIVDDQPQFLFSGYQGGCLPDPDGIPLGQCMVSFVKNVLGKSFEPTLITYLNQTENKIKIENIYIVSVLILFIVVFLIVLKN